MRKVKDILSLIRVHQWLKNGFVFLPILFDERLFDPAALFSSVIAFFAFSFVASSIYCLNDTIDKVADSQHPDKKHRPIASGRVSKWQAFVLMLGCLALGGLLVGMYVPEIYPILGFYYILNIAYCLKLKQYAIVDVFVIALGFVLRVVAGGFATGIELSSWIILMTFLLALFLAFSKRRDDIVIYNNFGTSVRDNIRSYNIDFLNQTITIISTLSVMCYLMYCMSPETILRLGEHVYTTLIFVLAGFIRYLQITMVHEKSGSPTKVLIHDRFLQLCIVGWVLNFGIILYF
ncbi:MAG: UbiA prenyltransferase family protein [bacterium]